MNYSLFNALSATYTPDLTEQDRDDLTKFATELMSAVVDQDLKKVATLMQEGLEDLSVPEDIAKVGSIIQLLEDTAELQKEASSGGMWDKLKGAAPVVSAALGLGSVAAHGVGIGRKLYQDRKRAQHRATGLKSSLAEIKASHPELFRGANSKNTAQYFSLLHNFAPDLAANPLVAGSILHRMHRMGASTIDAGQIKDLASAQAEINKSRESGDGRVKGLSKDVSEMLSNGAKMVKGR